MKLRELSQTTWNRPVQALAAVFVLAGLITWADRAHAAEAAWIALVDQSHIVDIPNEDAWLGSAHADAEAEAFVHWDDTDPPQVPTSCAKCHSSGGYLDFIGADGTVAGTVDNPAPTGTVIDCITCHNQAAAALDSVVMPSGIEIVGLGSEARCMQCHQGRESTVSVNDHIAGKEVADEDTISDALSFRNVHYAAAAATQLGTFALGGYEYEGKSYDAKFAHVRGLDTCIDCHDSHSLEVEIAVCAVCHAGVAEPNDLRNVRTAGSAYDYDGDGDTAEGIYFEIDGLRQILYSAIQTYAANNGMPIIYDEHSHPYFFNDPNANGVLDEGETRYVSWTPRLLKAAYNYQFSLKDPGAFAHNGKYVIQLLHDSIESLAPGLAAPLVRDDAGHFAGSEEPWRHWDEDGEVSGSCSKCHSALGLPFYLKEGVTISQPVSNGLLCETCHNAVPAFSRRPVAKVTFPSGAELDTGDPDSNLCLSCHQGRESTISVAAHIASKAPADDDTVTAGLSFRNVHYLAAGATFFGTNAKGAYEYAGKVYRARFTHVGSFNTCTECHEAHTGVVDTKPCSNPFCHGTRDARAIRRETRDLDGDGSKTEGIAGEIATFQATLYTAIQDYAANVAGTPIVYDAHAYPYFFADANGNGQVDEGESRYGSWTPRLLRAAYNYQYAEKDPGAFAHNGKYLIQVLYDSLADLGTKVPVNLSKMVRP